MKNLTLWKIFSLIMLPCMVSNAQTLAESNEVVKTLLDTTRYCCDNFTAMPPPPPRIDFHTPETFFSLPVGGDGWTPEGRRAAFDAYLASLASYDFSAETNVYFGTAEMAASQTAFMHYTNAVPSLKSLILNPTCTHRVRRVAFNAVVPMMQLDEDGNCFIEMLFTNQVVFSRSERGIASGTYIKRLLTEMTNVTVSAAVVDDAAQRFYRQRKCGAAGSIMFDRLFAARIDGYAASSNRLEFACYMIDHPESRGQIRRYYTSVTNQLLSSGQPLRQLNLGEAGE